MNLFSEPPLAREDLRLFVVVACMIAGLVLAIALTVG